MFPTVAALTTGTIAAIEDARVALFSCASIRGLIAAAKVKNPVAYPASLTSFPPATTTATDVAKLSSNPSQCRITEIDIFMDYEITSGN